MPPKAQPTPAQCAARSLAKFNISAARALINNKNKDSVILEDCINEFKAAASDSYKLDNQTADKVAEVYADLLAYIASVRPSLQMPILPAATPVQSSPTKKYPTKVSTADVPEFDGHASSWARFQKLFNAEITNNPNLDETRKVELLVYAIRKCPTATASMVRAYDNCSDALKELSQSLADKHAILHDVFCSAEKAPRLPKDPKLSDWINLHDAVQDAILKSDPNDVTQQSHLHALLSQKLNHEQKEYLRNGDKTGVDGSRSLADLNSFIKGCVQVHREIDISRALTGDTQSHAAANQTNHPRGQRDQQQTQNRATFAVTTAQTNVEPCYFCNGTHLRKNCPLSRQHRIAGCRRNGYCYRCLGRWAAGHNCNKTCRRCHNQPLHHFLCPCTETPPRQEDPDDTNNPPFIPNVVGNLILATETPAVNHINNAPQPRQTVPKSNAPYLGTVMISAVNPRSKSTVTARVLIDNGSQSSFITKDLVQRLELQPYDIKRMDAKPFGSNAIVRFNKEVQVSLQSLTNPSTSNNVQLVVVNGTMVGELPAPSQEIQTIAHEHGIQLADPPIDGATQVIDILVGVDIFSTHFLSDATKVVKPSPSLSFLETPYGWIVQGGKDKRNRNAVQVNTLFVDDSSESPTESCLCSNLTKLLHDPLSDSDQDEIKTNWRDDYIKQLKYDNESKRYEAPLPWYNTRRPEPNYLSAFAHAQHLYKRLEQSDTLARYSEALMNFVEKGYARQLPSPVPRDGHFIKHFPVIKEGSTTAVRPVFDASATCKGSPSLNCCVFKGVWDQVNLTEVILKWRLKANVLLADIRQAFMQIKIKPDDRKFVRFLWLVNGKVQAFEMTSLLFGASASPFILAAVLKHLFDHQAPALGEILNSTYMDDILLFAESLPLLRNMLTELRNVMEFASFELHKLTTTPSLAEQLNIETTKEVASCLGVKWRLADDMILFTPPDLSTRLTRRGLASLFAKVFDPLGLLGPAHTRVKLYMQEVIRSNKSWDEEISMELDKEARALIQDLQHLNKFQIPRLVRTSGTFEVWAFSDASAKAYGIAYYIHDLQTKQTRLLISRGRVAAKNKTIPRLELVGALLTAETWPTVQKCLPVPPRRVRFFTDSQVTWHRIQSNPSRFEPYVSTRVLRIQAVTHPKDWFHITGKQNPADLVSRGMSFADLSKNNLWFQGPPVREIHQAEIITSTLPIQVNAIISTNEVDPDYTQHLITNLPYRVLRLVVSRLLRYMSKYADLVARYKSTEGVRLELPTLADLLIWKFIQSIVLKDEIASLKNEPPLPKGHPFRKRNLFLDEFGLVRLRRRIQLANIPIEAKFPLVVKDHPAVRSYIKFIHETRTNHAGSRATIVHFQQFTEFPNMHRIVRTVVAECMTCRRYRNAIPFAAPMCHLPADRVTRGYAFKNVGMDIFGPIRQVAQSDRQLKFYGLIFACTTSRAVHLELVDSRSTQSILRAFHRFTDLYGVPSIVRSDNELSFEKLNKTLQKVYKDYYSELKQLQNEHGSAITWIFNAPEAPNWGGFYERLIGPVKNAIDKCRLAGANTYEKIETLLREAQRVVNSRPLLTDDSPDPLTPAHLVFGRALNSMPPVLYPTSTRNDVLIEYSRLQRDLDQFWNVWNQQYLPTLQANRWPETVQPTLNELVIIQRDGVARHAWDLARITRLIPGKDGIIRTVIVEPVNGGEPRRRAIHRLYPIERLALPRE